MSFMVAHHTDIGIKKKTNQDALLMKSAQTEDGEIGLFVVCDGMGGLSYGELASATVVRGLSYWFDNDLPELLRESASDSAHNGNLESATDQHQDIIRSLENTIHELNGKIMAYGKSKNATMGTTLTALLVMDKEYYIAQIGDSRVYHIDNKSITQLTKDQTLVAREVERGNLTVEEARRHPQRNVLLQCVGAESNIKVDITKGELAKRDHHNKTNQSKSKNELFILCTDGFYHQITNEEIRAAFSPSTTTGPNQMKERARNLVELVKARRETDNISIVAILINS